MTVLETILAEVDKRVAERLPARILDRLVFHHAKRAFATGCECEYCVLKRHATHQIAHIRYTELPPSDPYYSLTERIWIARATKRYHFRKQLRALRDK